MKRSRPRALRTAAALVACVWAAAAPGCARTSSRSIGDGALAIVGANVVDVAQGRVLPAQTVLISEGRITAVAPSAAFRVPADARVVNGRGGYLIPGLVETHAHPFVASAMGAARTRTDTLALLGAYVAHGITFVREAGAIHSRRQVAFRSTLGDDALVPRLFVSSVVGHHVARIRGATDHIELMLGDIAEGVDGVKIRNSLSDAEVGTVIAEARRQRVPVFGHTFDYSRASGQDFTAEAVHAGISGVMHVLGIAPVRAGYSATPPREDARIEEVWLNIARRWLHVDEARSLALIDSMVSRNVWLEPTLVAGDYLIDTARYVSHPGNRLLAFPYDTVRSWLPTFYGAELAEYVRASDQMKTFVRRFHEAGGIVLAGSDGIPAPAVGLHEELRLLVSAGLPAHAALRAATSNAARELGWDNRVGQIAPGMIADMVLLASNPLQDIENTRKIRAVVLRGRLLDSAALDRALADAYAVGERFRNSTLPRANSQ